MKILTVNKIPNQEYEVIDLVYSSVVKARNFVSKLGSSVKTMVGGNIGGLEKLYVSLREESLEGLKRKAEEAGADAIVGVRFDVNEITVVDAIAITAYGTLVKFK